MSNPVWRWKVPGEAAVLSCGSLRAMAIVYEMGGFISLHEWRGQKTSFAFDDEQLGELNIAALHALAYMPPRFRSESLELADAYLRGNDMVASYAESGGQRVAPEIYWRASYSEEFAATRIELIVSVRTGLLDSEPTSSVYSSTKVEAELLHAASLDPAGFEPVTPWPDTQPDEQSPAKVIDATHSSEHLFVIRLPQYDLTYAQMVHPSDFVSTDTHVHSDLQVSLGSKLFPERLEKGVIRRGRICGWFMPIDNDLETAVALARQFVDEPLPLTA
jgi:hypothetical protein